MADPRELTRLQIAQLPFCKEISLEFLRCLSCYPCIIMMRNQIINIASIIISSVVFELLEFLRAPFVFLLFFVLNSIPPLYVKFLSPLPFRSLASSTSARHLVIFL